MANEAIAGVDNGTTMVRNTLKWPAPVDHRRFHHVLRQLRDGAVQQEDAASANIVCGPTTGTVSVA